MTKPKAASQLPARRMPQNGNSGHVSSRKAPAVSATSKGVDAREHRIFQSLDMKSQGRVLGSDILDALTHVGLREDDVRIKATIASLKQHGLENSLDYGIFCDLIRPNILLVEKAAQGNMVIPDFADFCQEITRIYTLTRSNRKGEVADYIPKLARVEPELYGVALCTTDGQQFSVGDADVDFCLQSCCKPVLYCLALEEHGADYVHRHVGLEPSGRNFNELALSAEGKPHNPMINAGAILSSALIGCDLDSADRFDFVLERWRALSGNGHIRFDNSVYQSERKTADRNFALGYLMRENKVFPENTDLIETLKFFFQCCSIQVTTEIMAAVAATLANGGVCPTTGERIFKTQTVQHCLSLMASCGMYDASGEFAFAVGLPAKSGVCGGIMVVIPNVMGFCVWSPRLDARGNSVRGVAFCKELVQRFNFHNYDTLTNISAKTDPRVNRIHSKARAVGQMIWAASMGDQGALHRLVVRGFDHSAGDYDQRTPLHLAAAEGREEAVRYLIDSGSEVNPRDRWGGTPLDDAVKHNHEEVRKILERKGAVSNQRKNDKIRNTGDPDAYESAQVSDSDDTVEVIYAASEGNLRAIRKLVARGVDLAAADYDLRTPLHLAAAEGQTHIVRYFIDQGVPLDSRDRWGATALDDARRHGRDDVVDLLKSHAEPA